MPEKSQVRGPSSTRKAKRIKKALKDFGPLYDKRLLLFDRNMLVEQLEKFRDNILQEADVIEKELIDYPPIMEEQVVNIIAFISSNGTEYIGTTKASKISHPKVLFDFAQKDKFWISVNDFEDLANKLIYDVQNGKMDRKLHSSVVKLLFGRIREFAQEKYRLEYIEARNKELLDMEERKKKKGRKSRRTW